MVVHPHTRPKAIQDCIALNYSETVDYKVALRAKHGLCSESLGAHRYAFQLLPPYLALLRERDSDGHFHLELSALSGCFLRYFVCPSATAATFARITRRFISVDGTFTTGKFVMALLLAVGVDSNGEVVVIAWAIVEAESRASWLYFMDHLKIALPEFKNEDVILMSDRDKGLQDSNTRLDLGENVLHVRCLHAH